MRREFSLEGACSWKDVDNLPGRESIMLKSHSIRAGQHVGYEQCPCGPMRRVVS